MPLQHTRVAECAWNGGYIICHQGTSFFWGCLLGGVYVHCIHRMPGGVIIGDLGLCRCGPAFKVMCDVNCSSVFTSHCLLVQILPYPFSDTSCILVITKQWLVNTTCCSLFPAPCILPKSIYTQTQTDTHTTVEWKHCSYRQFHLKRDLNRST